MQDFIRFKKFRTSEMAKTRQEPPAEAGGVTKKKYGRERGRFLSVLRIRWRSSPGSKPGVSAPADSDT